VHVASNSGVLGLATNFSINLGYWPVLTLGGRF